MPAGERPRLTTWTFLRGGTPAFPPLPMRPVAARSPVIVDVGKLAAEPALNELIRFNLCLDLPEKA